MCDSLSPLYINCLICYKGSCVQILISGYVGPTYWQGGYMIEQFEWSEAYNGTKQLEVDIESKLRDGLSDDLWNSPEDRMQVINDGAC